MGWFSRRRDTDREFATTPEIVRTGGAAGVDGNQYSDYYDSQAGGTDINPLWSGRGKYRIIEEMRKSDPAVHSLLWMFKLPARQADWDVVPFQNGDDPIDALIAEAVECQLGLGEYEGWLDITHDELLQQDMLMLDFGAMFEEIVWGDPVQFVPLDEGTAEPRLIRPIARLAPRYPATVSDIETDKATGKISKLTQDSADAKPIPGTSVVPYVLDREGDWYGTSVLRYCYGPWKMKKALMVGAAIGWDRYAAGVPVIRHPPGGEAKAMQIGRNIRLHERSYVAFEGPPPPAGLWDIEILGGNGTLPDPTPLLQAYDKMIADSGLQGFKELGNTATGSRATADVIQMPYWKAVSAFVGSIAEVRRKQVVRRFVDVNFGTEYKTPTIKVSNIEAEPLLALSQVLANLASAGLTFSDRDTQDDIRDRLELRHLPDDVAQKIQDALEQTPPNTGIAAAVDQYGNPIPQEGGSINPGMNGAGGPPPAPRVNSNINAKL